LNKAFFSSTTELLVRHFLISEFSVDFRHHFPGFFRFGTVTAKASQIDILLQAIEESRLRDNRDGRPLTLMCGELRVCRVLPVRNLSP
jgi:hypothetical protein